jgi:hypothetical protein
MYERWRELGSVEGEKALLRMRLIEEARRKHGVYGYIYPKVPGLHLALSPLQTRRLRISASMRTAGRLRGSSSIIICAGLTRRQWITWRSVWARELTSELPRPGPERPRQRPGDPKRKARPLNLAGVPRPLRAHRREGFPLVLNSRLCLIGGGSDDLIGLGSTHSRPFQPPPCNRRPSRIAVFRGSESRPEKLSFTPDTSDTSAPHNTGAQLAFVAARAFVAALCEALVLRRVHQPRRHYSLLRQPRWQQQTRGSTRRIAPLPLGS